MDARRIDAVLPEDAGPSISGLVVGDRARVTFHSGYSDISGTAMIERRGDMIYWELLSAEQGEHWLPDTATLGKFTPGGFDDDDGVATDSSGQSPITSDELIGIWQASPMLASGWNITYQFFGNGRFIYHASQMGDASRMPEQSGSWTLDGTMLKLRISQELLIEGGTEQQGPGGKEIVGGTEKTVDIEIPLEKSLNIRLAPPGDDVPYRSIMIGDGQFWQFDRDPNAYP
jgi:hypothetical protein